MASEALTRVHNGDYERKDYKITEEGLKQYRKDCKLLKKHLGYDPTSFDNSTSEFKCDIPTIELSADNVIREISRDKGKKYPEGNVDLFIFVTEEEYEYFFRIFSELKWNGCANNHFKLLINSPFKVIYVCVWDIVHQRYEVDNPCIRKLEKTMDGGIQITSLGIG